MVLFLFESGREIWEGNGKFTDANKTEQQNQQRTGYHNPFHQKSQSARPFIDCKLRVSWDIFT